MPEEAVESTQVESTPTSIIEAVDGKGQEAKPVIGAASEKSEEPSIQLADEDPAAVPTVGSEGAEELSEWEQQAQKYLMPDEPKVEEEPDEDDFELSEEDRDKPIGRAAKRIQTLSNRAKEAEQNFAQYRQQTESQQKQFYDWAQQMQQGYNQLSQELQGLKTGQQPNEPLTKSVEEELIGLDVNDPDFQIKKFKLERDLEHQKKLDQAFEERLNPLQQKLQEYEQKEKERAERARMTEISRKYDYHARKAATNMLSEMPPDIAQKYVEPLGTLVLNAAYGMKTTPAQAGTVLQRMMTQYALDLMRARAKNSKIQASQKTSTPTPKGRGAPGVKGKGIPTREEATKAGFRDELSMMMAQQGIKKVT